MHTKNKTPLGALALGWLLGAALPPLAFWLILQARPELQGLQRYEEIALVKHINVELITMGMILNAALFFAFLRFSREAMSKGILIASLMWLLAAFIYKILL
ncbi:MAG: hypothetical protein RI842_03010 [Schleiferiaceae bacterium]|nr:hypothetical protein [Schleiferiaceae bacterium]MDR9441661.1 hypothetical protein [Schleiferiaceae bacterium]